MKLTKEEFVEWLHNPTTKIIRSILKDKILESRVTLSRQIEGRTESSLKYSAGFLEGMESVLNFEELFDFDLGVQDED